jgi:hypothetical protein
MVPKHLTKIKGASQNKNAPSQPHCETSHHGCKEVKGEERNKRKAKTRKINTLT